MPSVQAALKVEMGVTRSRTRAGTLGMEGGKWGKHLARGDPSQTSKLTRGGGAAVSRDPQWLVFLVIVSLCTGGWRWEVGGGCQGRWSPVPRAPFDGKLEGSSIVLLWS